MSTTVNQVPNISATAAIEVMHAAVTAATKIGVPSAVAVVDSAGHLIAFTRMDGAAPQAIQIAQDKAYTAAGFGLATGEWHEMMNNDAPLAAGAPSGIARLVAFGGGLPIVVDGAVIGAIGVSGGHWSQDHAVAEAGLIAIT
jgi:uncharacterized protein GlcG (DUF336 family)